MAKGQGMSTTTAVIAQDFHFPYHDETCLKLFLKFIKETRPDQIIIPGDLVDFYSISKFSKDPSRMLEANLSKELALVARFWMAIRNASKRSRIVYTPGNHEDRLQHYVWQNAPALAFLDELKLERLLKLKEYGVEYHKEYYWLGDLLVTHGSRISKHAGWSAKMEFEKNGCSGISGHCFSEDTEILTYNGWKKYTDISENSLVATRNKTTGKFEWNWVREVFVYDNFKELYNIKTKLIDLFVTDQHGLLLRDYKGLQFDSTALNLSRSSQKKFTMPCGAEGNQFQTLPANMLRLLVNIIADGCFEQGAIRWHLRKERKIKHLRGLLNDLKLPFSEYKQKHGTTKIRLPVDAARFYIELVGYEKRVPEWFLYLSKECVDIILNEYSITDGCKNSASLNSYQISSAKEDEIDILQSMFIANGYRATKTPHKTTWTLTVNTNQWTCVESCKVKKIPYSGKVWCVQVDNGTVIVRRNGKAVTTLNSHRDAKYSVRNMLGQFVWLENGCCCDLKPEYIKGVANWSQGFSEVVLTGKSPRVTFIPIINGKLLYNGRELK